METKSRKINLSRTCHEGTEECRGRALLILKLGARYMLVKIINMNKYFSTMTYNDNIVENFRKKHCRNIY